MREFPPLQRRLVDHFAQTELGRGGQEVFVGTRPLEDGWVAAVVRVDGFGRKREAQRLGAKVHRDLRTYLSFVNQERVPVDAVVVEVGQPEQAKFYSLAVFVTLLNLTEAQAFASFLTDYADPR